MNQTNYQKKLDQIIEALTQKGEVPSLLLHSCCAPCSSYTLEYLSNHFQITVLYYNPNIYPEEEYTKRVEEQKRLINELSPKYPIQLITEEYHSEEFYNKVKGLEKEPEGGARCFVCYRLRMEHTAQLAKALGFDYFTTTLSISPLKNAEKINAIGEELGTLYEVKHLPSDFKKKGGYQRSIQLSKEHNLYRQNYCGCVFSKR
ncbi:MAG: epoxyqueuosine reductase QueH [Bacteroidales bacterium]|nr:epoxyqueuosine reductase QueH [Bacteroidales bacterium]